MNFDYKLSALAVVQLLYEDNSQNYKCLGVQDVVLILVLGLDSIYF